jgi:Wings apart-like protein regulation of heterochromatin
VPDGKERPNTRLSPLPDRSSGPAVSSNNRCTPPHQTDAAFRAAGTPSRRRLIDSLRALDTQEGSSHSDPDSPQQLSHAAISRESTPIPTDYRHSQGRDSQKESQLRQMTHEAPENIKSPMSASPKITYSRQRSFLRNIDLQGDLSSLPMQSNSVDNTEAEQPQNSRTVRSIHELRRAGVNARFQGLVDSIFEDIEDRSSSASVRRSGFIQLCEKLLDETFTQRFVETGAFERLTKCMPARGDLITILLSVYACALVLRLSHIPPTVYTGAWPKLIASAPTLLSLDDGTPKLITQRRHALSKVNQAAIRDISLQFGGLSNLDEQECLRLSPRRLILRALHSTMRKVREKDLAETIPVEVITKLVDILLELAQQATERDIASDNFAVFESIISILETYTTSSDITGKAQQDVLMPLTNSSHLLSSLGKGSDPQDIQLLTLHLRLILNITNASTSLCESFATAELIRGLTMIVLSNYSTASDEFIDEKKDSLDIIILALGALINLTEVSEAARQNIIHQKEGSQSLLEQVISIFTKGLKTVSEVSMHDLLMKCLSKLTY